MLCVFSYYLVIICRLTENWSNAAKYEQVYLDLVKSSENENKEKLIAESNARLQEYNRKSVLKMSMKSILG